MNNVFRIKSIVSKINADHVPSFEIELIPNPPISPRDSAISYSIPAVFSQLLDLATKGPIKIIPFPDPIAKSGPAELTE